jgi:uncharacterized membrane protein
MDSVPKVKHTRAGLDRLVFFSDAVVAIAITLLVLPLVEEAQTMGSAPTIVFFQQNSFSLLAAGVTFGVIGSSWREHHRLFEQAIDYSPLLIRVNFFWLALIAFLPVATELLVVSAQSDRLAIGLYIGTIALLMALCRLEEFIMRRSGLLSEDARLSASEEVLRWLPVALRLIAFVLATTIPGVGLWALLIVLLEWPIEYVLTRHARVRHIVETLR